MRRLLPTFILVHAFWVCRTSACFYALPLRLDVDYYYRWFCSYYLPLCAGMPYRTPRTLLCLLFATFISIRMLLEWARPTVPTFRRRFFLAVSCLPPVVYYILRGRVRWYAVLPPAQPHHALLLRLLLRRADAVLTPWRRFTCNTAGRVEPARNASAAYCTLPFSPAATILCAVPYRHRR